MKKARLPIAFALACFVQPVLAQTVAQTAAQTVAQTPATTAAQPATKATGQTVQTAPTSKAKPSPPAVATPTTPTETSNEELKTVVARDQAARTSGAADAKETDADRRAIVRQMIDAGALRTGLDYRNAALVMQHGDQPDDYLLAHSLAIIGASKDDKIALWLCASTLDRYLQSLNWPQIYGTQFVYASPNTPPLQDPYNRTLLSDALRQATGVPTLDEQVKQAKQLEKQPESK